MTREEAIKEIESNIKAYIVEVKMSDGLHVHITDKCNPRCQYFTENKYSCLCVLYNDWVNFAHQRLPQCLAIKPEYKYIAKKLEE